MMIFQRFMKTIPTHLRPNRSRCPLYISLRARATTIYTLFPTLYLLTYTNPSLDFENFVPHSSDNTISVLPRTWNELAVFDYEHITMEFSIFNSRNSLIIYYEFWLPSALILSEYCSRQSVLLARWVRVQALSFSWTLSFVLGFLKPSLPGACVVISLVPPRSFCLFCLRRLHCNIQRAIYTH